MRWRCSNGWRAEPRSLRNVVTIEVEDERIRRIFVVVNPGKLPEEA
jgi:hypothetical protein